MNSIQDIFLNATTEHFIEFLTALIKKFYKLNAENVDLIEITY